MTDYLSEFLDFGARNGLYPHSISDIKTTSTVRHIRREGDSAGEKTIGYKLIIEAVYATGVWFDWKTGAEYPWTPTRRKEMSAEERKALAERVKADKEKAEQERQERWAAAAVEANDLWNKAKAAESHPYLERKGISGKGTRVFEGVLLIPARDGGKITSLQRIFADGGKRFITGGRVEGCYGSIPSDDRTVIGIAEGYATAATVHAVTGLTMVIAFDTVNLMPVAENVRAKYPNARLIFFADNDQWRFNAKKKPAGLVSKDIPGDDLRWTEWREAGLLENIGVIKANNAAAKVGGHVLFPDIPSDDPAKRTDWNDWPDGLKDKVSQVLATAQAIGGGEDGFREDRSVQSAAPDSPDEGYWASLSMDMGDRHSLVEMYAPPVQRDEQWESRLQYDDKGKLRPKSLINAHLFLEHHPTFAGLFCYDEFAHEKIVCRCPPWANEAKFIPHSLTEDDTTMLAVKLEEFGISPGIQNLKSVLSAVIRNARRNPAKEYFNGLEWDGVERLDTWLRDYCGAEWDQPEYLAAVGRKWLTAAVARVYEPGCKFDHILVLEGKQDVGKSRILKELATIHGRAYFDDTIRVKELGNPATVPKLQGVLIIELAEMTGFKDKRSDDLKQAITTTSDRIVQKWENEPTSFPRQFVFAGTINPQDGYLHDPTGNRRFWPVKTGDRFNVEALKADKEQIWAEAVVRYREGEKLYLSDELKALAMAAQEARRSLDAWHPTIEALAAGKSFVATEDIWIGLNIRREMQSRVLLERIAGVMMQLGYRPSRARLDGLRQYGWKLKEEE